MLIAWKILDLARGRISDLATFRKFHIGRVTFICWANLLSKIRKSLQKLFSLPIQQKLTAFPWNQPPQQLLFVVVRSHFLPVHHWLECHHYENWSNCLTAIRQGFFLCLVWRCASSTTCERCFARSFKRMHGETYAQQLMGSLSTCVCWEF